MITAADIFDRLSSRSRERTLSNHDILTAAAKRHCKGETVDAGSVEEALFATGQTVEDFRKLCEYEKRRSECFAKLEVSPAAKTRRDKLDQQIAAETTKFEEIRKGYETRVAKLQEERLEAAHVVDTAAQAKDWLLDPRNVAGKLAIEYREALKAQEEAGSAAETLERAERDLRKDLKSIDAEIAETLAKHEKTLADRGIPNTLKKDGTQYVPAEDAAKIEDLKRKRARVEQRLEGLLVELEAARLLVPPADSRVSAIQKKLVAP
jgi:hypothetical protein